MEKIFVLRQRQDKFGLIGPLDASETIRLLNAHELSWLDLVYTPEGDEHWSRLYEISDLRSVSSRLPTIEVLREAEKIIQELNSKSETTASAIQKTRTVKRSQTDATTSLEVEDPSSSVGPWFLQMDGSEFGPFSPDELMKVVGSKRLKGKLFTWKQGLSNWVPLESPDQLVEVLKNPGKLKAHHEDLQIEKGSNARVTPRRSLVATVRIAKNAEVIGICMDISLGGIQLFSTSSQNFEQGKSYELEILPATISQIPSFSVRGRLVWKTEEKFGFQFLNLDAGTKKVLENYIGSQKGFGV